MHSRTVSCRLTALVLALGLATSTACSTTKSLLGPDAEPRPYSGVRSLMNADAVEALTVLWPVDFVLSAIADTLLLPYTMGRDKGREND